MTATDQHPGEEGAASPPDGRVSATGWRESDTELAPTDLDQAALFRLVLAKASVSLFATRPEAPTFTWRTLSSCLVTASAQGVLSHDSHFIDIEDQSSRRGTR